MKRFSFILPIVTMLICCIGITNAQFNEFTTYQAASIVVGQANFTNQSTAYNQSTTPNACASAVSSKGMLAVVAQSSGRIMLWDTIPTENGKPADLILGKPNFTSTTTGCSQTLTRSCDGVTFSPDGNKLIVADGGNNRVLIWNSIPTTNGAPADVVIGQTDFTSNTSGCLANKLYYPWGVKVSPEGKLFIVDATNNRVLIYNKIPEENGQNADIVIGQDDFVTPTANSGNNHFNRPRYVEIDTDGKVLISDAGNNRIMIYNSIPAGNGEVADIVIGQVDFITTTSGCAANKFYNPIGVTVSPDGRLAIGEFYNHRVLIFNQVPTTNGASADVVLGQPNFTSNTAGISDQNMRNIYGINFDLNGRLLVNGRDMHRVMIFGELPTKTAELEMSFSGDVADACGGSILQYVLKIQNNGEDTATNVIALTDLPYGFTPTSTPVASVGTYNSISGYWNVPQIPANENATLSFMGTIAPSVTTTIYANIVASDQLDTVMTNNAASITLSSSASEAPVITDDPDNLTVCVGNSASFTCGATGTGPMHYQWQVNTGSGTYSNITDDGNYSGSLTNTLNIAKVGLSQVGNLYRCQITCDGPCSSYTLNAQLIQYNDVTAPEITCPANVAQGTDNGVCTAVVNSLTPVVTDDCNVKTITWALTGDTEGVSASTGLNDAGGQTFNRGITTVTYTATDVAGNSSSASFTVTITDDEAPVAPTLTDATGECSVTVTAPTAEDNCVGTVTGTTTDPLTYTTQGS
ncbi:MAG: HYR domain-containing protein, partial [Marinilabiliaceae bacterium]|nr:HYR domain-containing protein [Marinilabiliaceae bacterium]